MAKRPYIIVVGHGPDLARPDGAVNILTGLGAEVRTLDLWDEPSRVAPAEDEVLRGIIIEAMNRPDLAAAALRALRKEPGLLDAGAIVGVTPSQVAHLSPELGFDDFTLIPYVPAELYARIRNVEWRRSEFTSDERIKIGPLVIDREGQEVRVAGNPIRLTAREFALLAYLCERRGRVVSRLEALERVWGDEYEGGPRTVDIHVRRLRSKLGSSLPLVTLRGSGYKVLATDEVDELTDEP